MTYEVCRPDGSRETTTKLPPARRGEHVRWAGIQGWLFAVPAGDDWAWGDWVEARAAGWSASEGGPVYHEPHPIENDPEFRTWLAEDLAREDRGEEEPTYSTEEVRAWIKEQRGG